ncbi:hypothetical protein GCM10010393_16430 [Streptomyces gobitricini]|uniref:Transposase n=1 Tax=Streptomyces gobitricini TaxID=68211 RepID=A0ABN3LL59_9ACTN
MTRRPVSVLVSFAPVQHRPPPAPSRTAPQAGKSPASIAPLEVAAHQRSAVGQGGAGLPRRTTPLGTSRLQVVGIGKDDARQARRPPTDAGLHGHGHGHGHKYAIDAASAVVARQRKGQVTVFTSDV